MLLCQILDPPAQRDPGRKYRRSFHGQKRFPIAHGARHTVESDEGKEGRPVYEEQKYFYYYPDPDPHQQIGGQYREDGRDEDEQLVFSNMVDM